MGAGPPDNRRDRCALSGGRKTRRSRAPTHVLGQRRAVAARAIGQVAQHLEQVPLYVVEVEPVPERGAADGQPIGVAPFVPRDTELLGPPPQEAKAAWAGRS